MGGSSSIAWNELPSVSRAELPIAYESAKRALAECASLDECKTWADKAMALASYGKQANDETLMKDAMRIKARAIRRCGELLAEIEPAKNQYENGRGGASPSSRKSAADAAGLSDDQRKDALRVASVPEDEFERQIESDDPPTIGKLAEQGTRKKPDYLGGRTPEQFQAATALLGAFDQFERAVSRITDVGLAIEGLCGDERNVLSERIQRLDEWIGTVWDGIK